MKKVIFLLTFVIFAVSYSSSAFAHAWIGPGSELKSRVEFHGDEYGYTDGRKDEIGEQQGIKDALMQGKLENRLADPNRPDNTGLNEPRDDWQKNEVESGSTYDVKFSDYQGQDHATRHVKFYITKDGWNPDDGLQKEDFEEEPIHYEDYLGDHEPWDLPLDEYGVTSRTMKVKIPEEKSGYHVLAYEWDIADINNSWYSVLDLNVSDKLPPGEEEENPGEEEETPPVQECPSGLHSMAMGDQSTEIYAMWNMSAECESYHSSYKVYLNGEYLSTTSQNMYKIDSLKPGTFYEVKIVDEVSNVEMKETFNTDKKPEFSGIEDTTIELNSSFDSLEGVKATDEFGYEIKDIIVKGRLNTSRLGEYELTYIATDFRGYQTRETRIITVVEEGSIEQLRNWDCTLSTTYKRGELVINEGVIYEVVQDFTANGDPGWILAPSLFTQVSQ